MKAVVHSLHFSDCIPNATGFVPSNKRLGLLERFRRLPIIRNISANKMRPVLKDLERDLKKDYARGSFKTVLPEEGHRTVSSSRRCSEDMTRNYVQQINVFYGSDRYR